jgi:SnoaL-like domain
MSYSISTLMIRNLRDVFGENDSKRRRVAIDEIYTEDCVFYDPSKGAYRGRDEIDRIAGEIKATHPDFRYQPIAEPEELGNGGRVKWVSGRPGDPPAYAGTDFIIARDGRIAAIYLFFDKLPEPLTQPLDDRAPWLVVCRNGEQMTSKNLIDPALLKLKRGIDLALRLGVDSDLSKPLLISA